MPAEQQLADAIHRELSAGGGRVISRGPSRAVLVRPPDLNVGGHRLLVAATGWWFAVWWLVYRTGERGRILLEVKSGGVERSPLTSDLGPLWMKVALTIVGLLVQLTFWSALVSGGS